MIGALLTTLVIVAVFVGVVAFVAYRRIERGCDEVDAIMDELERDYR